VNARRILLIESLEAAGAAARDAHARARALLAAGYEARCAIVEPAGARALHVAPVRKDTLVVQAGARGQAILREWVAGSAADAVLVASAVPGGGGVGCWLARGSEPRAWWWPTGVSARAGDTDAAAADADGDPMGSLRRAGPLPVLPGAGHAAGAAEPWPHACAGLEASVLVEGRLSRTPLPLWDGDYLLVPAALGGAAGTAAIEAFAALCEAHDGLDLVVLADPQPAFERLARARGIGFRVHFAGPAPRDAELAWLGAATAALIAGDAPLSGGLVLRALARGCALLAAPGAATAAPLESWLAARGLDIGAARDSLTGRLERAFSRDSAWRERARAATERHGIEAAAGRLAFALDAALARRRAA
jgi:hypothetical protein